MEMNRARLRRSFGESEIKGRRTHEGFLEVRSKIRGRRSEVGSHVCTMLGTDHRVLVFVRCTPFAAERFRYPVRGTDECGLGIQVLFAC